MTSRLLTIIRKIPNPYRPVHASSWDVGPSFSGMHLRLSRKIIEENRFIFKNHLDCGEHEPLYPTKREEQEIRTIFYLMLKYYDSETKHVGILISYVNVLISLIAVFDNRQFSANPKQYNRIVSDFQQYLKDYYNQPVSKLPSVQYFTDQLGLTPNYLGTS